MSYKRVSRREGAYLRKRVAELEEIINLQSRSWSGDWPGRLIYTVTVNFSDYMVALTARTLGHAVVVIPIKDGDKYKWKLYGDKL